MRNFPGAVSIVAAGASGDRRGLTASAVCSLSDVPPSVIVCVNRAAGAHDLIMAGHSFSINSLCTGQERLARVFSGSSELRGEERFAEDEWSTGFTGAPVLTGAACVLECLLYDFHTASSHTVFFGHVVSGFASVEANPLVYLRGNYAWLVRQA